MGLLQKIITVLRGGLREVGETIVDANGIRIFEQEIKDAEEHLARAKQDLASVLAKEMQISRDIEQLLENITKYEEYALQALNKSDDALALEVSQKIADLNAESEAKKQAKASFNAHADRLKDMIKTTERSIADMQRQLTVVKTTDSVHKATAAITNNYASSGSKLLSAKESLDRIQKRQQETEDRMKAGEQLQKEFSGENLEDKLKAAGIVKSPDAAAEVLAKLKAKQGEKK